MMTELFAMAMWVMFFMKARPHRLSRAKR